MGCLIVKVAGLGGWVGGEGGEGFKKKQYVACFRRQLKTKTLDYIYIYILLFNTGRAPC